MMTHNKTTRLSPGRKTILAIAVAATLVNGVAVAVPGTSVISSDASTVVWGAGNVTVNTGVSVNNTGGAGVIQAGSTLGTLDNSGKISGSSYGVMTDYTVLSVDQLLNNAGGTISGRIAGIANVSSTNIGLIDNRGLISASRGVYTTTGSVIGVLNNSGTINGGSLGLDLRGAVNLLDNSGTIHGPDQGIYNSGTIGSLDNSGTISSDITGIYNASTASIGQLNNSGLISGQRGSIINDGFVGALSNSGTLGGVINRGTIGGATSGLFNNGTLAELTNSGTIIGDTRGILNDGTITKLTNTKLISGGTNGIFNDGGTITELINGGTITGTTSGIFNRELITSLYNGGTISGGEKGIFNFDTITELNNGSLITGDVEGIYNLGTLSKLNNTGTISGGSYAINNVGDLGVITNSGTIAGDIRNVSNNDLVISGGTGSIFGVLTGYSASMGSQVIGLIDNQSSNVVFKAGNLLLNDNIDASGFTVKNNGATLQINNDISIQGNYTQAAGAGLVFGVADNAQATGNSGTDAGYGRLYVEGAVTLASGTSVGLTKTGSTYAFAQGQRYLVIGAADGANSDFNEKTLKYTLAANGLGLTGENIAINGAPGANGLVLTVVGSNGSSNAINGATTSDARSSLGGLFSYTGTNEQLMNLARAGAALGSDGNSGGGQLSPTATASAASTASVGSTQRVFEVASGHMDSMRTAQTGNGSSGVATGENGSGKGLWGQAFGGSSRQDEREDIAGYHANYSGMLLGADAELNDSWRAGGLFSYATTSVNNDGVNKHNSADIDSYGLIAYATYTANPWYVNLSAGAVQHQYDTKRQINITGFDGTAKGNYDGMQYLAAAQFGYPIDLGSKTTLTPIAGLTYSTLQQDSYTEKDGNGAALHVNSDDIDSLKSDLGAKLERSYATSYGELIPAAQLTWRHEFRDEGLRSVANYSADVAGETSFSSNGPSAINDTGVLNLGVTLVRSNNLSLSAKYALEAGSGYTANTGTVQARWDF